MKDRIFTPQSISILMLVFALNPDNPYGYYILLRFVLCASCAYLAFRAYAIDKIEWAWILGITAALYNPIVRVHLTREIWSVINIITIVILIVTFWSLRTPQENKIELE